MPINKGESSFMTPEFCKDLCTGYKYAAVTKGNTCRCGDDIPPENDEPNPKVPSSECSADCVGQTDSDDTPYKKCGDSNRFNIFAVPESKNFDVDDERDCLYMCNDFPGETITNYETCNNSSQIAVLCRILNLSNLPK